MLLLIGTNNESNAGDSAPRKASCGDGPSTVNRPGATMSHGRRLDGRWLETGPLRKRPTRRLLNPCTGGTGRGLPGVDDGSLLGNEMTTLEPIKVLFVCLGNICRSPMAEAVFRSVVRDDGTADRFEIDSAGTSGYHEGEAPDARAQEVARRRGITLTGRSRPITDDDLERFDYVIVMDANNLRDVSALAERVNPDAEVHLLREFDPEAHGDLDVPDPYYGGEAGFEQVQDMIERSCVGLLEHIRSERTL